ncbi:uncharacterized protein LOC144645478 isoform X5 [Oculina patagonica]
MASRSLNVWNPNEPKRNFVRMTGRISCERRLNYIGCALKADGDERRVQKMSILPPQKGLGIPGDERGLKGQNVAEQENTWFTTTQVYKN